MEIAIGLIALAIIIGMIVANVKIAQSKGQSVGLWVVLGILFNPIALIMKGNRA